MVEEGKLTTSPNEVAISIPTNAAVESDQKKATVTESTVSKTAATAKAASSVKSYQWRALSRKTLSYQKRQNFTNICCVCICPLMMVLIAGILSKVFENLFLENAKRNGIVVASLKHCSKVANTNGDDIPLVFRNPFAPLKDASNSNKVFDVNYYQLNLNNATNFFPCSLWLENAYPFASPYEKDPGVPLSRDTTFLPDPKDGWFDQKYASVVPPGNIIAVASSLLRSASNATAAEISPLYTLLQQRQSIPWNYIFTAAGVDVGSKNSASPQPSASATNGGSGFLSGTNTGNFVIFGPNSSRVFLPSDFFVPQADDPVQFMVTTLQEVVDVYERAFVFDPDLNDVPRPGNVYQLALLAPSNLTLRYPAMGAVYVNSLDDTTKKLDVTLQAGRVARLQQALALSYTLLNFVGFGADPVVVDPPTGFKFLYQLTQMTNALAGSAAGLVSILHGFRAFPQTMLWNSALPPVDFGNLLGKYTFPFGLSFLLPIFVLTLVKEKEDRILIMMKMHGLSTFTYYLAHYLHFFLLQIICSIVFIVTGFLFKLKFFFLTEPGVYIVLLLLWANMMVGISFLLSLAFSKSRLALIVTFVIVVFSCMINLFEDIIFNYEAPPTAWYIWPFFAFYHAMNVISDSSGSDFRDPYKMSDLVAGDPVSSCMLFLLFGSIIIFALMVYLSMVLKTEYGVPKPWHFIFSEPYAWIQKKFSGKVDDMNHLLSPRSMVQQDGLDKLEDSDVQTERFKVENMELNPVAFASFPLIISNIRKVYETGKIANKAMCLAVEKNIVFGLLGPNGAGKSTLIQMMTGLYKPTSGTAYVAGYDINTQMPEVYRNIGVCPQHDVLWDDLTVEEHLLFYARLRGINAQDEGVKVKKAIEDVNLSAFRRRLSKGLSGGEKRRLSIAIALLGDVPLVFLDEPTTGLDPEVRRTIWNIIQTSKQGKTIILTTHSMEEADLLASRIGIMAKGVLRCVGTPLHLKRRYGRGFKLTISFLKEKEKVLGTDNEKPKQDRAASLRVIESLLPEGAWRKVDQGGIQGSAIYEFDDQNAGSKDEKLGTISKLLDKMEALKSELDIEDWGISQTSLEEVFLNIVRDEDADASEI